MMGGASNILNDMGIYKKYVIYFVYFFIVAESMLLISLFDGYIPILIINFLIILTYFIFRPKEILHPNNMVMAFYTLYVIIPSLIDFFYLSFQKIYQLTWIDVGAWQNLEIYTYYDILLAFLIMFFSFFIFTKNFKVKIQDINELQVKGILNSLFVLLIIGYFIILMLFLYKSGGIISWATSYKETYLKGREGLGFINFLFILISYFIAFLLGIRLFFSKNKILWITLGLLFIIITSFFQGLKSKLIILLMLFFSFYLRGTNLKIRNLLTIFLLFFLLLYITTVIRTEGYYSSLNLFIEGLVAYFNAFLLHNEIIKIYNPDIFRYIEFLWSKPFNILGLSNSDYNLSVYLTKMFFPEHWYNYKATQQWPLTTSLYFNYYGLLFGWIPLIIYSLIISLLYRMYIKGRIEFMFIYLLEFIRIFSVLRDEIFQWQIYIYIPYYLIVYLILKHTIKYKRK